MSSDRKKNSVAGPPSTVRTSVCLILSGYKTPGDTVWPAGCENFVRKLYKAGVDVVVIGPRPGQRLGTKSHLRHFDRHEVVTLKKLARAKNKGLELRLLGKKLKAWTRVRADVCVVSGPYGVWPESFPGWTSNGVLSIDALGRWVKEYDWVPGNKFIFLGSSNRVLGWATRLLELGALACTVVEKNDTLTGWRSHLDRFIAKGGRFLVNHQLTRIQDRLGGDSAVFFKNEQGTLILDADTVILSPENTETLSGPLDGAQGLFYVQRQYSNNDPVVDEGLHFSRLDWDETYFRVMKRLGLMEHGETSGGIERIKEERRLSRQYTKNRTELVINGKNLSRDSLQFLKSTGSVPTTFATSKPMASLECLEKLPCMDCVDACPHDAITKTKLVDYPKLLPEACVGCGLCVSVCPSGAAVMVKETVGAHMARYFLPAQAESTWKENDPVQLLNRKGDVLATGKVTGTNTYQGGFRRVVEIESPAYNVWDARSFRRPPLTRGLEDLTLTQIKSPLVNTPVKGWITLNGVRRHSPVGVPITVALWSMGYRRFEDALFCEDGGCRLCEVKVNGQPKLACQSTLLDGDELSYKVRLDRSTSSPCFCSMVSSESLTELKEEGLSTELCQEILHYGEGTCKGRWCVSKNKDTKKVRPVWPGFSYSPWIELWVSDL